MPVSVEFRDKEVKSPVGRILLIGLAVTILVLLVILGTVTLSTITAVVALLFLLTVPAHFILRVFNRRGFYIRNGNRYVWSPFGALKRR